MYICLAKGCSLKPLLMGELSAPNKESEGNQYQKWFSNIFYQNKIKTISKKEISLVQGRGLFVGSVWLHKHTFLP